MVRIALLFSLAALVACSDRVAWNGSLEDLLHANQSRFGAIMADPAKHRLQIIYTQIDRDTENRPSFRSYTYRVDAGEYFYPASTVKLPTALLALEKLNAIGIRGLDLDTPMITGAAHETQAPALEDPTAPGGLPTVGHYVRKILLVSDNDAFNRLYEFLGQEPLNELIHGKGYTGTRIMHRLEIALPVEANRLTNPVEFYHEGVAIYRQGPAYSSRRYLAEAPIPLGKAEVVDGQLLERPKDFAEKNAFPLQELHDVLQALMFPASVPPQRRFALTRDQYRFVYRNMSGYPGDSGIPDYYDAEKFPDGYVKFLMYGGDAESIPDNIHIFNKVGDAYGFLTDAAYIVDFDAGVEFMLAATVYTNANETFNDNEYEYDELGLPFLRDLGQAIYEIELQRERPNPPDLSRFRDLE